MASVWGDAALLWPAADAVAGEEGTLVDGAAGVFVLVGGWPGSGKTTLAGALAAELGTALLSKDVVKELLMRSRGRPGSVEESRGLGREAVLELLRLAKTKPGAVLDSTWFPYTEPLVRTLPGELVEVRCLVPVEVARQRYRSRCRDPGHFDELRTDEELWGVPVAPLGVGPLIEVDTSGVVDIGAVASSVLGLVT